MKKVISKDGTKIAYAKTGKGQPIILVDGALCYPTFGANAPLVPLLARKFTIVTYYRRGRVESGDTKPYAVEREIEDIEAIVKDLGEPVYIFGSSSGGALALEATNQLKSIKKLAIYEAPFIVDNTRTPLTDEYLLQVEKAIAESRPGDAVKMFMKAVEVPSFFILLMQLMPVWNKLKSVAHTLPYDFSITINNQKGKTLSSQKWRSVTVPTIIIDGGKSPIWMRNAMKSLAKVLRAEYTTLAGQTHIVKATALAPVLEKFFQE